MVSIAEYIDSLEAKGRYSFTVKKVVEESGKSANAVRMAVRRLEK